MITLNNVGDNCLKYILLSIPITFTIENIYFLNLIAVTIAGHVLSHVSRMTEGSRFKVLLFVTYSIIQDIISSEM